MFKHLSCSEIEAIISQRQPIIADVRDEGSYKKGHINKAIHLTMAKLNEFCNNQNKSVPIILYCYHGISSQSVAQHLVEHGFLEVYSLMGGFEAWKAHHSASHK